MTGVLQFSINLRPGAELPIRVFGEDEGGSTMFPGFMIQNPRWSDHKHKNFNCCVLGNDKPAVMENGNSQDEISPQEELRRLFFFERWM